jgi:uncharacterized protein
VKILLARIPAEGSHYEGSDPASILELEGEPRVRVEGEVEYHFYAQRVSGELVVRGSMEVPVALQCARCAEFFSTTIEVSDFLRAYSAPEEADSVDVSEEMREEIVLHLPVFPVCGEACKGLCAQCGANLNEEACRCEKEEKPDPWAALNKLNL